MPTRVMNEIGVKKGMAVADIGAGQGYFTFRLAERVGSEGHVYANEIDEAMLNRIQETVQKEGFENVTVIRGEEADPLLPKGAIDMALMVNVFNLIEDKVTFLAKIKRSLKPGGTLVIVQWDAEKMDLEWPERESKDRELFTTQTNLRDIQKSNYEIIQLKTFLPMQMIYICRPAEPPPPKSPQL